MVSHFPSWDRLHSGEINHFLFTEGTICSTVTYCNSFQTLGRFDLVGKSAVVTGGMFSNEEYLKHIHRFHFFKGCMLKYLNKNMELNPVYYLQSF